MRCTLRSSAEAASEAASPNVAGLMAHNYWSCMAVAKGARGCSGKMSFQHGRRLTGGRYRLEQVAMPLAVARQSAQHSPCAR